jgi:hypothetical protein
MIFTAYSEDHPRGVFYRTGRGGPACPYQTFLAVVMQYTGATHCGKDHRLQGHRTLTRTQVQRIQIRCIAPKKS